MNKSVSGSQKKDCKIKHPYQLKVKVFLGEKGTGWVVPLVAVVRTTSV